MLNKIFDNYAAFCAKHKRGIYLACAFLVGWNAGESMNYKRRQTLAQESIARDLHKMTSGEIEFQVTEISK